MINYLGDKFYKYYEEEDTIEMLRLKKMKNENQYVLEDLNNTSMNVLMSKKDLEDNYTKLSPDGYITFSIVNDNGINDVIVSLHRKQDLKDTNTPFIICRQNALNIFNQLGSVAHSTERMTVGCSVNIDTCPADIEFISFLSCSNIVSSTIVAVYIDDTINDILNFIKTEKYDNTLSNLSHKLSMTEDIEITGTCNTLKELLEKNDFMWDFRYAFDITKVSYKINIKNPLSQQEILELENIFKHKVSDLYIFKYTREIDFKKIKKSYKLIEDTDNNLFVIAYIEGEWVNESYERLVGNDDLLTQMKLAMIKKNLG